MWRCPRSTNRSALPFTIFLPTRCPFAPSPAGLENAMLWPRQRPALMQRPSPTCPQPSPWSTGTLGSWTGQRLTPRLKPSSRGTFVTSALWCTLQASPEPPATVPAAARACWAVVQNVLQISVLVRERMSRPLGDPVGHLTPRGGGLRQCKAQHGPQVPRGIFMHRADNRTERGRAATHAPGRHPAPATVTVALATPNDSPPASQNRATALFESTIWAIAPGAGRVRGGKPRQNPPGRGQGSPRASLAGPGRVRGRGSGRN